MTGGQLVPSFDSHPISDNINMSDLTALYPICSISFYPISDLVFTVNNCNLFSAFSILLPMPRNSAAAGRSQTANEEGVQVEPSVHNDASILDEVKLEVVDQARAHAAELNLKIEVPNEAGDIEDGHYGIEDINSRAIDELAAETTSSSSKRKRSIHDRPDEWKEIAEHFDLWGRGKTWVLYKDLLGDRTPRSVDQALKTWSRDLRENNAGFKGKRAPAYGFPIDLLLLKEVRERMEKKLPVDDVTLRTLLVNLLQIHERMDLMTENGGTHLFLHGWAGRFWKRHKLPSRLVSSKKVKIKESEVNYDNNNNLSLSLNVELDDDKPVSAAAHLIALHNAPRPRTNSGSSSSSSSALINENINMNMRQIDIPVSAEESDSSED
jgi:hypothetical protein